MAFGGEEQPDGGADIAAAGDQDTHPASLLL
jgi:hypothetical protein